MSETADEEFRPIFSAELALLVRMTREAKGWSQETLAELSQLNVRTIQRVEDSEPSSVDTRRALARAFEIKDLDAFNKPHTFSSFEKIKREVEEFEQHHVTLPAFVASSGRELFELADKMTMHMFEMPEGMPDDVAKCVAELYDYLRDYGDVRSDEYSYAEKLKVCTHLDEYIQQIKLGGSSVCYARRSTKIVGKNWVDKTPWPLVIGYVFVKKIGEEPKQVVVQKRLDFEF